MRLVIALVVLVACDSGEKSAPPTPRTKCLTPNEVEAKRSTVVAQDTKAFRAALAEQKLTLLALGRAEDLLGEGMRAPTEDGPERLQTVKRPTGTFIAGDTYWTLNQWPPTDPEFVVDTDGRVYVVERKADPQSEQVVQCGCSAFSCGSPCSACGETRQIFYGPLPKDARFDGTTKAIAYKAPVLAVEFAAGACPPEPCPP